MTGRELILYILANELEDEVFFENGKLPGFITPEEMAIKCDVGVATVVAWIELGALKSIKIGNRIYIPGNAKLPERSK